MKIAVVGGNSQVGTEACFLLRAHGYEVVPIVRSLLGAAFLRHHGFECRVADIGEAKQATGVLADVDHVILSFYVSDVGGPSRQSRRISDTLIENAVRYSLPTASVVYFSSIRAFSRRVDPTAPIWGTPYDNEKRHGERTLFCACRNRDKRGYAFRLGHVFGKHQSKTRTLQKLLDQSIPVILDVDPDKASNIVHTVTIAEALINMCRSTLPTGVYSLVNSPQWTWREVVDYYGGGRQFAFSRRKRRTNGYSTETALNALISYAIRQGRNIFGVVRPKLLPTSVDRYFQYRAITQKVKSELRQTSVVSQSLVRIPEFGYLPIPGPFVRQLTETRRLLDSADLPNEIF